MDLSKYFILLNDEPKTLQIDAIQRNGIKGYSVRFKNNKRTYNYGCDKVVWLNNPEWKDPTQCKVFVDSKLQNDIREIWRFDNNGHSCWRVIYNSGFVQDDAVGRIVVTQSCLQEAVSKDVFVYMKNVATINTLCKDEQHPNGLLSSIYNKVDFIADDLAAACYLNPAKNKPKKLRHSDLIYPFGCNASQKIAVSNAFEHQISVIQGPPGTGKTQTILNIIANIVRQGKTVMVVSNNNSATTNVQEKLEKYGVGFIAAALGNKNNKEHFIANQPTLPLELEQWDLPLQDSIKTKRALHDALHQLDRVYALQNKLAELRQELQAVELEWEHFKLEQDISDSEDSYRSANSSRVIWLWLKLQSMAEGVDVKQLGIFQRIKLWWLKLMCKYKWHIRHSFDAANPQPLIIELQTLYYVNRCKELADEIADKEHQLRIYDVKNLTKTLTDSSLTLLEASLHDKYKKGRAGFANIDNLSMKQEKEFQKQYPVVLSTTFSARLCMFGDAPYDYLIMDEASQVSSDTGTLALTCAKNAVIVGDTKQLPNVETEEDRMKLREIAKPYNIADGYDCAEYSFLESILKVIPNVTETMLREHYRCHPRIINFCNQKFYGGNLLVMTEDKGEENVLSAFKIVKGNHAIGHFNQREIDVVKEEVLPTLADAGSIGIVTPYNNQVDAFNRHLNHVKAGTIHKYQGREEDAIIMSVVDNQISEFADDAKMLNVAVSRAQKRFCLVVTGNEQEKHSNIMDLLDYIAYNNCIVTESKLASIFDYLYEQYTEQRMAFLESHAQISEFASENLTYALISEVIASDSAYSCLKVICHIPLRQVVKDTSMMSTEEMKYASNYNTHLDFLIINKVSKQPVLAIETDGYSYHNDETEQHQRDMMKDHILSNYGLPLLRLSTKGSGEREKIISSLNMVVC